MGSFFSLSTGSCLFFSNWQVNTSIEYFIAWIGILFLTFAREVLSLYRTYRQEAATNAQKVLQLEQQQHKIVSTDSSLIDSNSSSSTDQITSSHAVTSVPVGIPGISNPGFSSAIHSSVCCQTVSTIQVLWMQVVESFLFVLSLWIGYLLMLLVMSYQVYVIMFVLLNSFLSHAITRFFYYPWYDKWVRQQQGFINTLAEGSHHENK
jgi:hypothetical protein